MQYIETCRGVCYHSTLKYNLQHIFGVFQYITVHYSMDVAHYMWTPTTETNKALT